MGKKDIYSTGTSASENLPMFPFSKNSMFASVDLPQLYERGDRISSIIASVMDLASKGVIDAPQPLQMYKPNEIEQAFRAMQREKKREDRHRHLR